MQPKTRAKKKTKQNNNFAKKTTTSVRAVKDNQPSGSLCKKALSLHFLTLLPVQVSASIYNSTCWTHHDSLKEQETRKKHKKKETRKSHITAGMDKIQTLQTVKANSIQSGPGGASPHAGVCKIAHCHVWRRPSSRIYCCYYLQKWQRT